MSIPPTTSSASARRNPREDAAQEAHQSLREQEDDEHDGDAGQQFEIAAGAEAVLPDHVEQGAERRAGDHAGPAVSGVAWSVSMSATARPACCSAKA